MTAFVVLVTGSRGWNDPAPIRADLAELQAAYGDRFVVRHGACRYGADALADRVARQLGITVERFAARWETHDREGATAVPCRCSAGKRTCPLAGFRRNAAMLAWRPVPDLVLAYRAPGRSNGTDDMVCRSEAAGVPIGGQYPASRLAGSPERAAALLRSRSRSNAPRTAAAKGWAADASSTTSPSAATRPLF